MARIIQSRIESGIYRLFIPTPSYFVLLTLEGEDITARYYVTKAREISLYQISPGLLSLRVHIGAFSLGPGQIYCGTLENSYCYDYNHYYTAGQRILLQQVCRPFIVVALP